MSTHRQAVRYPTVFVAVLLGLSMAGCTMTGPATLEPTTANTAQSSPPGTSPTPGGGSGNTPEPSPSTTTAALTVFYVAVDDQGKSGPLIGCGDSLVATETEPRTFTNPVEAAMLALLGDNSATHGESGLLNAVAASELRYVSSKVRGDQVTVDLSGTLSSGGTCDDPRIVEQLKYTAKVAAGVGSARILFNGVDIEKALSQK